MDIEADITQPSSCRVSPAPPSPRDESGFTLIELMIAVFMITVGVLGISQVFAISSRHTANARLETVANSLAQEIREKIMSETFDDVQSIFDDVDTDGGTLPDPAQDWGDHVVERLGPEARGEIDVVEPDEDPALEDGMVRVTVTLSWYEGTALIELPFQFLIAKIGA